MKTPIEQLIEFLDTHSWVLHGEYRKMITQRAKALLEVEKKTIEDAYDQGWVNGRRANFDNGEKYYKDTSTNNS